MKKAAAKEVVLTLEVYDPHVILDKLGYIEKPKETPIIDSMLEDIETAPVLKPAKKKVAKKKRVTKPKPKPQQRQFVICGICGEKTCSWSRWVNV